MGIDLPRATRADQTLDIRLIPLTHLWPDPEQPRRIIPSRVALAIQTGQQTIWQVYAQHLGDEPDTPHARDNWRMLQRLMTALRAPSHDQSDPLALINPVTVVLRPPDHYQIVTGEFRFWAYVGVALTTRTKSTTCIPARLVSQSRATHQVQENTLRAQLNAVELARGFQRVWDELAAEEPPAEVQEASLEHPGPGRKLDWPTWSGVAERIGVSESVISRHLPLLALEPVAQQLILAYNLPERRLRYLLQKLAPAQYNPEITRLLQAAIAEQPIWSADRFRVEVDRVLGYTDQQAALDRVTPAITQLAHLARLGWLNSVGVQRLALHGDDPARSREFNRLIADAREALPLIAALADLTPVNPQGYGYQPDAADLALSQAV